MKHINIPFRQKKNVVYTSDGALKENGKDWCDCLDVDCPGCFFPCPKCKSCKCGPECRCNRKWYFKQIVHEGSNTVSKWEKQPTLFD